MLRTTHTIPFRDHQTWVQITTPESERTDALPLFVLHGGPGMAHNYVANIAELADETGRTVIHYDQIGCGNSTHLPDAPAEFWTPDLFVDEFHTIRTALGIDRYHVLGQSWGGMLGAEIAVRRPDGLASLSICNSPASMQLWVEGAAELRAQLPADTQAALARHEADGTVTDPEYLAATAEFYRRHVCRIEPMPEDFADSEAQMEAEPTVYHTMNGPNEFHVIGTLRNWTVIERLPAITAPVLVVAGEFDEATPATWQPYVDNIADVRSHVFPDTSHCTHLEKPAEFRAVIADFLASHDLAAAARV
ncbi:proline imino-peptidase [Mycolicibacterium canariasense]|uniref:Proline iminopeptidase n=1 Tax=Mycolicibacterium canariasense TaxID=228230 RepID=A0A117I9W0_MYCCR|nr:proline iminopeptidase-family hydrolase [Mycolicibacterium canariasense]MCV7209135.1 proline iminopeptidase-family hydrolase [Mycolicibacterium canariasense]ORV06009.1 amino acid amidase [Mycolicibacterium canariasense]GAS95340.1 proline imino-peptidase [Mycolicibacterium canariasense]